MVLCDSERTVGVAAVLPHACTPPIVIAWIYNMPAKKDRPADANRRNPRLHPEKRALTLAGPRDDGAGGLEGVAQVARVRVPVGVGPAGQTLRGKLV